jgi:phosphopantetheine adenylyltransferase
MMMTIDEVVMAQRLKELRREAVETDLYITNAKAHHARDMDKRERHLERLIKQIKADEQALYWVRMNELLHTPCWRYRVAS